MYSETSPLFVRNRKASFDISSNFVEKAESGYALNLDKNIKLSENDEVSKNIWIWLNYCKASQSQAEGILSFIEKSESTFTEEGLHKIYTSPERKKCLSFCGWDFFQNPETLESKCSSLQSSSENTMHSVMYAIFSFNYEQALNKISEPSMLIPILQNIQSKDTCLSNFYKSVAKHESNPFTRNILWFLAGPNYYIKILESLTITESIGFCLRFLNDSELKLHLKKLIIKGYDEGYLETLIISGFDSETPGLLTKYYERTSDLQTVGIVSVFAQQFIRSDVLDNFVFGYKSQLNRLELYNLRCEFEIEESKLLNKKVGQGKCIRCYYCGNSTAACEITTSLAIARRGDPHSVSKPYLNHCPSCPYSLPKCCVCLNNIKSLNPHFIGEKGKGGIVYIELLTWCEKCHHGGHTSHLIEWFNENNECAVNNCGCNCKALDLL